jgi:hypothetical protein
MEDFFNSVYYYTNSFYGEELDNYLYETDPGYQKIGLATLVISVIASCIFYYVVKPVRNQTRNWFLTLGGAAILNFFIAIYYTATPLINNKISEEEEWSSIDCLFMGITDVIWTLIFYTVTALIIKWWSPCKYVPFRKF